MRLSGWRGGVRHAALHVSGGAILPSTASRCEQARGCDQRRELTLRSDVPAGCHSRVRAGHLVAAEGLLDVVVGANLDRAVERNAGFGAVAAAMLIILVRLPRY